MCTGAREAPSGSWYYWAGTVDWRLEASSRKSNALFVAVREFGGARQPQASLVCSGQDNCNSPLAGGAPLNNAATPLPRLLLPPAATGRNLSPLPTHPHAHKSCLSLPELSQTLKAGLISPVWSDCSIHHYQFPSPKGPCKGRDSLLSQGFCTGRSCHLHWPWLHFPWLMLPPSDLSIIPSGESSSPPL